MDRRTLLRSVAGLLAGAGLAGCTGADGEVPVTAEPPPPGIPTEAPGAGGSRPSTPPGESAVSIADYGGRADTDGTLIATVTVRNEGDRQQVRLVRVTVEINDLQATGDRFVSLAPGEERTVSIHLDVSFETWNRVGSITPEVVRRTPATPIPTDRATPTDGGTPTPGETPTDTPGGAGKSPTPTPGDDTRSETGTATDSATATESSAGTE